MSGEELGVRLRELQGKLLTLRTQTVTEKVEDPTAIGKTRREIARVLTARTAMHLASTGTGRGQVKDQAAEPAAEPAAKGGAKKTTTKTAAKAAGGPKK